MGQCYPSVPRYNTIFPTIERNNKSVDTVAARNVVATCLSLFLDKPSTFVVISNFSQQYETTAKQCLGLINWHVDVTINFLVSFRSYCFFFFFFCISLQFTRSEISFNVINDERSSWNRRRKRIVLLQRFRREEFVPDWFTQWWTRKSGSVKSRTLGGSR